MSLPPRAPGADIDPRTLPQAEESSALDSPLHPAVAGPGAGASPWLIGGGSAALGLLVFLFLASHRTPPAKELPAPSQAADSQAADAAVVSAPPPPSDVDAMQAAARAGAPAAPPPPPAVAVVTPPGQPLPVLTQPAAPAVPAVPAGGKAPVLVVDFAGGGEAASTAAAPAATAAAGAAGGAGKDGEKSGAAAGAGLNGDEQFAERVENGAQPARAKASMLRNPSTTAPQGTIIPAVLETALNSDLPGFARAVVSRDVRSFDGSNVLIPRGSRVIGEYKSAASQGQSRVFVIWTRVLRPDGGSIEITSGGGDELGRAGLAGKVDRHFFERFSGAVLMTVLNAGAYAAGALAAGNSSTVVVASSGSGTGLTSAASSLAPADIPPTIKVAQGTPIRIFVQRDLDFTGVGATGR